MTSTDLTARPAAEPHGALIGVSLKMYFDHRETVRWCQDVRLRLIEHPLPSAVAEIVVLPGFASLAAAATILDGTGVRLGAQDLFWEDSGPYTGEVDGMSLRQVGCTYAEVGHAERRRLFHEDLGTVSAKLGAALRHGLTPIICVGESSRGSARAAADQCMADLDRICESIVAGRALHRVVVAYEPEWAIGADDPAPVGHIGEVCDAIGRWIADRHQLAGSQVIYGGSAGPGLLTELHQHVDGLFLGRMAHDVDMLDTIITEATQVADSPAAHIRTPSTKP